MFDKLFSWIAKCLDHRKAYSFKQYEETVA